MRASTSLMPPPGNGTMNLTVWVGNVPCAPATLAASAAKSPAAHAARIGLIAASHSSAARLRRIPLRFEQLKRQVGLLPLRAPRACPGRGLSNAGRAKADLHGRKGGGGRGAHGKVGVSTLQTLPPLPPRGTAIADAAHGAPCPPRRQLLRLRSREDGNSAAHRRWLRLWFEAAHPMFAHVRRRALLQSVVPRTLLALAREG